MTFALLKTFSIVLSSDSLPTINRRANISGSLSNAACSNSFLAFICKTLDHFSPWALFHVNWRDALNISLYSLRLSLFTDVVMDAKSACPRGFTRQGMTMPRAGKVGLKALSIEHIEQAVVSEKPKWSASHSPFHFCRRIPDPGPC